MRSRNGRLCGYNPDLNMRLKNDRLRIFVRIITTVRGINVVEEGVIFLKHTLYLAALYCLRASLPPPRHYLGFMPCLLKPNVVSGLYTPTPPPATAYPPHLFLA